jgi:hypothetical protein
VRKVSNLGVVWQRSVRQKQRTKSLNQVYLEFKVLLFNDIMMVSLINSLIKDAAISTRKMRAPHCWRLQCFEVGEVRL